MYRENFAFENYYHIFNRGLDKRNLFLERKDYSRFIRSLYYFNDINFLPNNFDYEEQILINNPSRKEMVEILAWCLMPNHFHLILSPKIKSGITKFMRRLGTGYTMYTNIKYKRSGHVFQGPFKAKHIKDNEYLQHLTRYIHLNPLKLIDPNWEEKGVKNVKTSKNFIIAYPWSSLGDYLGEKRFPEIINDIPEIIFTKDKSKYGNFLWEWLGKGIPLELDRIKF